ncbi:MAG: CvpA family protein [Pacificimonas sp.]
MSDLTAFDIGFLGAIGLFAILGLARGFVVEVLSLLAWVAGIFAVNVYFDEGRELALGFVDSPVTAATMSVIGLFLAAFIVVRLFSRLIGSRVKDSIIGPIDRVLGLGFGAAKGLMLAVLAWMLLTLAFDVLPGDRPEWLADARAAPLLSALAHEVQDFVAERREREAIDAAAGYSDEQRDALDALVAGDE